MMRRFLFLFIVLFSAFGATAQQKYFVDGFHGGVYGHYPLMTYTQYLVDQLEKHPEWYIGLEIEPETWDTVKIKTPEAYLAFRKWAQTDRVECTNPSYAQPYLYCISGESIIRQFQYGIEKTRRHFPNIIMSTYAVEEPCFTSCIPTILPQLGFKYSVLKCPNTCWGGYSAPYGKELVNFIGPDGTSMLTVPRYECEGLERESVWQTDAWGNKDSYFDACFEQGIKNPAGMTYQDAGWTNGPWIGYGKAKQKGTEYTRWTKYIEEQSAGSTDDSYHFTQEEVCPGLMWGAQVLQRLAQQCRRTEYLIPQAEKIAAMAHIENGFRINQADIDEAWRTLMLSQHHDCWIVPYNKLNHRGTWADNVKLWTETADRLALRVMDEALLSYNAQGEPALKILNTTAQPRKEVVNAQLSDGRVMDVEVDVPAFGYTVIPARKIQEPAATESVKLSAKQCVMENDLYTLTFDLRKGGIVKSIKDKTTDYDYVDGKSDYGFGELKGYFADEKRFISSTENKASAKILEDNELVKSVEIEGTIAGTAFRKIITLRKGSPIIDCKMTIDWKGNRSIGDFTRPEKKDKYDKRTTFYDTRYALSLMFPTAMKQAKLYKNAPFDVCESRLESTFFNSWDSLKHNVMLEWIDLHSAKENRSMALLTDHTTSYSYSSDHPLALTAQYGGGGLWGRNHTFDGATTFRYALVPHTSSWDKDGIQQLSTAWNEPLVVVNSYSDEPVSRSFIDVADSGYEIVSVTRDRNDLLIRLFNASGDNGKRTVKVRAKVASAMEVDLLNNEVSPIEVVCGLNATELSVSMNRFAVRTIKLKLAAR